MIIDKYNDPTYEEVSHEDDGFCEVTREKYESFLEGYRFSMKLFEDFMRENFDIDEAEIEKAITEYRNRLVKFTWLELRADPEYSCMEFIRNGVIKGKVKRRIPAETRYYSALKKLEFEMDRNEKRMCIEGLLMDMSRDFDVSLEEISDALYRAIRDSNESEMRENVRAKESLVGRCFVGEADTFEGNFRPMKKYYKVLSARSTSEKEVACLCFDEHPAYTFGYMSHLHSMAGDGFLGTYSFLSFDVDDYHIDSIKKLEEIPLSEYDAAARRYMDELLTIPWIEDHKKHKGKLPIDDDWAEPRKE